MIKNQLIDKIIETKNKELIYCSVTKDPQEIKYCIYDTFDKNEPNELIISYLQNLNNDFEKFKICKELAIKYLDKNTQSAQNLSLKFSKLAKQYYNI